MMDLAIPNPATAQLETCLGVDIQRRFAGRNPPVDSTTAHRWGTVAAEMKRRGKPLPIIDALLAATALRYNLTVVSRHVA